MRSWGIALAGLALAGCAAAAGTGNEPPDAGETAAATTPPSAEPAGDALTDGPTEQAVQAAPTQTEQMAPTAAEPTAEPLPDLGVAPELENEVWLNVDAPLRLADLRGKVVLLDMWTFG
jgi:hypothetical protein